MSWAWQEGSEQGLGILGPRFCPPLSAAVPLARSILRSEVLGVMELALETVTMKAQRCGLWRGLDTAGSAWFPSFYPFVQPGLHCTGLKPAWGRPGVLQRHLFTMVHTNPLVAWASCSQL